MSTHEITYECSKCGTRNPITQRCNCVLGTGRTSEGFVRVQQVVVRTGRTETMERKWWSVEYIRDADVAEKPWRLTEAEAVRHAAALADQIGDSESAWAVEVVERRTRVQATEDSSHNHRISEP